MDKRVIYQNESGGVSVITPAPKARLEGEDDDAFIQRVALDVPEGYDYKIVNVNDLPPREERANWKFNEIKGE